MIIQLCDMKKMEKTVQIEMNVSYDDTTNISKYYGMLLPIILEYD